MAQSINHILSKEGILTTFSIAKRISVRDVQSLQKRIKGKKDTEENFKKLLKERVMKETQKALLERKIPGVLTPEGGPIISEEEKKKLMELTYLASVISKKLGEKNIDKYHSCYIINAIINMIGLTESDFDEFHRKFSKNKDDRHDDGAEPAEQ
jgi:hypothetical protein